RRSGPRRPLCARIPGVPAPPRRRRLPPRPPRFPAGRPAALLALDLPAEEVLDPFLREIVGQLPRRMLHEVCRNAVEGAADAPIARHAAAADGVDHATGRAG